MRRRIVCLLLLFGVALIGPPLLAQGVAPFVESKAIAVDEGAPSAPLPVPTDEWGSSVVWAFLSSSLLEFLKRRQLLGVSERLAWGTQRLLGIALAIATAAGIHASFDAATGVLTVTGLLWPSIWTAAGESLRQFVLQEATYRVAVKEYRKTT